MNGLGPNQQKRTVRLFTVINNNLKDIFRPRGWLSVKVDASICQTQTVQDIEWGMNQDSTGRRPLPVRDYVVSIEHGPQLLNYVSKVWYFELSFARSHQTSAGIGGPRNKKHLPFYRIATKLIPRAKLHFQKRSDTPSKPLKPTYSELQPVRVDTRETE